jgi:hypothetical protein
VDDAPGRIIIQIELEPGDGPIRGSVYSAADGEREFEGWIALAAAVESARMLGEWSHWSTDTAG